MDRIGLAFTGAHTDGSIYLDGARLAESAGYESVLLAEDYFFRDTVTTASAVAAVTETVEVGLFVNPFTRHPALTAMSVASLDELSNGRVTLSVGAGPRVVMEQFVDYEAPLWSVKHAIELVRACLDGGPVSYDEGIFDVEDVTLGVCPYLPFMGPFEPPRTSITTYVAAVGPQMLKMAGDVGDGWLVSVGFTPEMIERSTTEIERGLDMSGRTRDDFDVAGLLFTAPEITDRVREFTAMTIAAVHDREDVLASGIDPSDADRVSEAFDTGGVSAGADEVTDEMAETYVLTRDGPTDHIGRLDQYVGAGVDIPVLIHLGSGDLTDVVEMGVEWAEE